MVTYVVSVKGNNVSTQLHGQTKMLMINDPRYKVDVVTLIILNCLHNYSDIKF